MYLCYYSQTLTFQKDIFICLVDSVSKMMENAFYFILKAHVILKVFKFLSSLFGPAEETTWLET